MVPVQMTSTTMELVALVSLCVLTRCGTTFAAEHVLSAITVAVEEGKDAILPCSLSTKENIENMVFDWKKDGDKEVFLYDAGLHYNQGRTGQDEQFTGRVFHFEDELKNGNASIKIHNTKTDDNGSYTCTFPRKQDSLIILVVDPDPERNILKDRGDENIPGAAPKPYVRTLNETSNWALLQCEVHGASPKPKVEWQDSDGNILQAERPQVTERGGRYDVILQTTVTRTDHYRCVATQEEIKHQISAETYMLLSGAAPEPSVTILEQSRDWALLKCIIRGASPKPVVQWQDSDGNIIPAEEPQVSERGGSYDIILQTTVTKTDNYHCVATQEEVKHRVQAEIHVYISGPEIQSSNTWIIAIAVVFAIGLVLGVCGLLAVQKCRR